MWRVVRALLRAVCGQGSVRVDSPLQWRNHRPAARDAGSFTLGRERDDTERGREVKSTYHKEETFTFSHLADALIQSDL